MNILADCTSLQTQVMKITRKSRLHLCFILLYNVTFALKITCLYFIAASPNNL